MTTSAYVCAPAYGPVTKDIATEAMTVIDTTDCTISGTNVLFPLATNSKKAILPGAIIAWGTGGGLQERISWWSGFFGVSAQPNSGQIGLVSSGTTTTARYVRIGDAAGTDTKLRIYDKSGNLLGTSAASISTSTQTEVCVCFDCLTLPTVYVHIWIGGVYDSGFNSGLTPANFFDGNGSRWGEVLGALNRGADMTGHDFTVRYTSNAALAPHLTAFPRLKVYGGGNLAATKEGNSAQWGTTGDAVPNSWKNIAATHDFPNDGNTTFISTASLSFKHLFRWGNGTTGFANPVNGLTIDAAYQQWVASLISAGKAGNDALWRMNGSEAVSTAGATPGTSYVGVYGPSNFDANRPGGGAFTAADFGLESGTSTSVDATHMTDTGAAWDTNGFAGLALICGTSTATITSNTGTVILHGGWTGGTPSPGTQAYIIACSRLQFGVQSAGGGTVSVAVTEIPGPTIVAYSATLPLGKHPKAGFPFRRRSRQHLLVR